MMQESFRRYYRKYLGAEPDPELIRILASMRLHGYLELVHGDYTMKERLFLARAIGIHAGRRHPEFNTIFKGRE